MPSKGEDGSIYATFKGEGGKRTTICILQALPPAPGKSNRGRRSLLLTDEGADWITREMASGALLEELADQLGITCSTLYTERNREKTKKAVKEGHALVKTRLRKAQLRSALNGSATMQVWLGKQLLHQRDQPIIEIKTTALDSFVGLVDERTKNAGSPEEDDE